MVSHVGGCLGIKSNSKTYTIRTFTCGGAPCPVVCDGMFLFVSCHHLEAVSLLQCCVRTSAGAGNPSILLWLRLYDCKLLAQITPLFNFIQRS